MSIQENNLNEILTNCPHCNKEINYAGMVGSVCFGGILFLHGKNDGYYGFDCPACGGLILRKDNIAKISHLKHLLKVLGQHPDGSEYVLQYNSFPYRFKTHRKYNPKFQFIRPISSESRNISHSELSEFIEISGDNEDDLFCSYYHDDKAFTPAIAIWWYKESEISEIYEAEVNKKIHKLFPRYYYYDSAFELFNKYVWDYNLKFKFIQNFDLTYPSQNLRNSMAVPVDFESNMQIDFLNLKPKIHGKLIPFSANGIIDKIEPLLKPGYWRIRVKIEDIRLEECTSSFIFSNQHVYTPKDLKKDNNKISVYISSFLKILSISHYSLSEIIGIYADYFSACIDTLIQKDQISWASKISNDLINYDKGLIEIDGTDLGNIQFDIVEDDEEEFDVANNGIILNPDVLKKKLTMLEQKYPSLKRILTQNLKMMELKCNLCDAAKYDSNVLILGETGTGKELFAFAIHEASERKGKFVTLNCSNLSKELFESKLFGHKKGSFSGAVSNQKGAFESAHRGTLFLDELGEIPVDLQAKLLRAVEYKEIIPVGRSDVLDLDVKLVFATNRDLQKEVENHNFREDLFFRVFTPCLAIPPLRDRVEDISLLVVHFALMFAKRFNKKITAVSKEALDLFQAHNWRGNVRELMRIMEMVVLNCRGPKITTKVIPDLNAVSPEFDSVPKINVEIPPAKTDLDEDIKYWMKKLNGNKTQVGHKIGRDYRTVLRRCQKLGL